MKSSFLILLFLILFQLSFESYKFIVPIDGDDDDDDDYEENPYPENVKTKVKAELKKFDMMPSGSLEGALIQSVRRGSEGLHQRHRPCRLPRHQRYPLQGGTRNRRRGCQGMRGEEDRTRRPHPRAVQGLLAPHRGGCLQGTLCQGMRRPQGFLRRNLPRIHRRTACHLPAGSLRP